MELALVILACGASIGLALFGLAAIFYVIFKYGEL